MAPTPERWQQIEALYHAAMERGRGVLDGADPELRREVESLLAEAPTGQGLLDQPAAELLAEAATIELKQGARLGPYQIESLIGQGGMGKVYRARDTRLGRTVAIKTSNARFSERFEREARAVAALNHPHICHLYDVGPDYLVMEYIEGTPLKGPFALDETLQYAEQICDAPEAAHQKNIIHRDLKPGNPCDARNQAAGFRDRADGARSGRPDVHNDGGRRDGHAGLHGAGTAARKARRCQIRYLLVRVRAP
jgi:hypothetical protein